MEDRPPPPKPVEPNFEASGCVRLSTAPPPIDADVLPCSSLASALAAETNMTASGAVLKYNEPPEARKPTLNWRLYVFKGKEQVGQSRFLPCLRPSLPSVLVLTL